jgi:hypothetical protein
VRRELVLGKNAVAQIQTKNAIPQELIFNTRKNWVKALPSSTVGVGEPGPKRHRLEKEDVDFIIRLNISCTIVFRRKMPNSRPSI